MVEGYTDVIALHQAGIEDVVAIMGTAITPDQLKKLAGLGVEKVQLALDADSAGANAMIRAQRVAAERTLELEFAAMPEGEDPGRHARGRSGRPVPPDHRGGDRLRDVPGQDHARPRGPGSPTGRDRALKEIAPVMQAMGETVTRDELMKEVVDRLDTDVHRVTEAVRNAKAEDLESRAPGATGTGGAAGRRGRCAGCAARSADAARGARAGAAGDVHRRPGRRARVPGAARSRTPVGVGTAGARVAARTTSTTRSSDLPRDDEELVSLITELAMRAERDPHSAGSMEMNFMLLEQQRLEDGITAAREAGDMEEVQRLSQEGSDLTTRISRRSRSGSRHLAGAGSRSGTPCAQRRHMFAISVSWDGGQEGRTKAGAARGAA